MRQASYSAKGEIKMKRIVFLTLALAMIFTFAACGGKADKNPGTDMSVLDILKDIMAEVDMEIETDNMLLDSENFQYFAFIDYKDGYEAACNEALINACAHSVVLVRVPDGEDAAAVAKDIEANADPRKWICVEAEKTEVVQNGNLVLLVMSNTDTAASVVNSFNEFCKNA